MTDELTSKGLDTEDYDYELPAELIAQEPLAARDASRLLVVDRKTGDLSDRHFHDILDYLTPDDCLILNNSRVIPARIFGTKRNTGAHIEFLLHKRHENNCWEVMARPVKRLKPDTVVDFSENLSAQVIAVKDDGLIEVRFDCRGIFLEELGKIGEMPLPPYIKKKLADPEMYQTVYSLVNGSSAAPTAGLHFTEELLQKIAEKGVKISYVTLHVGLGTFLPVKGKISEHKMHSEFYVLKQDTVDVINETRKKGGRVFCVGTTTVRTLESNAHKYGGVLKADSCETDIFIYPGFDFMVTDCLITNFHLPKSTLIMLISAFYDREKILEIYKYAVKNEYRFFSFGDAMLLL